jgi:hypothetical protein
MPKVTRQEVPRGDVVHSDVVHSDVVHSHVTGSCPRRCGAEPDLGSGADAGVRPTIGIVD